MEAQELIAIWKRQAPSIDRRLQLETFAYLLRQHSAGALTRIRRQLGVELLAIALGITGLNGLFFLVGLPLTALRWTGYGLINLIGLFYLYCYLKALSSLRRVNQADLRTALQCITGSLHRFRRQGSSANLPVGVIVLVTFSASQDLLSWLPWLLMEFLMWRWVLSPHLKNRFEGYLSDLEYALKNLDEQ